jgi:Mg2+/citrate symporter
VSADLCAAATIDLERITLSDDTTLYAASGDAAVLRLADGLIHRPVLTVLMLAASLWATVELARWTERRERKRQAVEKRQATMRLKKLQRFLEAERRRVELHRSPL